jgi:hypothetical protein
LCKIGRLRPGSLARNLFHGKEWVKLVMNIQAKENPTRAAQVTGSTNLQPSLSGRPNGQVPKSHTQIHKNHTTVLCFTRLGNHLDQNSSQSRSRSSSSSSSSSSSIQSPQGNSRRDRERIYRGTTGCGITLCPLEAQVTSKVKIGLKTRDNEGIKGWLQGRHQDERAIKILLVPSISPFGNNWCSD